MLEKIKKWLNYPEITDSELEEYHLNKKVDSDKLQSIYNFKARIFVVVLVLMILYFLIEYLLF